MAPESPRSIRDRLTDADLSVLPVTHVLGDSGDSFQVIDARLRSKSGDGEFEVTAVHTSHVDPRRTLQTRSVYRFVETPALKWQLGQRRLHGEAESQLAEALQLVHIRPYQPDCIRYVFGALFPAKLFSMTIDHEVTAERPTTRWDPPQPPDSSDATTTLGDVLCCPPDWLTRTSATAGGRQARLEHVSLVHSYTGEEHYTHVALSVRTTGPSEDHQVYVSRLKWGGMTFNDRLGPDAEANVHRMLESVLHKRPVDLVDEFLDALLRHPGPTWRAWVNSGALGTLLQPRGDLARSTSAAVSLRLSSPSQHVGRFPGLREHVFLDLVLEVEPADEPRQMMTGRAIIGLLTDEERIAYADTVMETAPFLDRPSVTKAVGKLLADVQVRLDQLARTWPQGSEDWCEVLPSKGLLSTLIGANKAAVAVTAAIEKPPASAAVIAKGDKVLHPMFGIGVVQKVEKPGPEARLTVEFASGTKVLATRFVTLER